MISLTAVYTEKGRVPIPEGWTREEVIQLLEEMGHVILEKKEKTRAAS